jgi:cell division protein FtsB
MNVDLGIWDKLGKLIIVLLVLAGLVGVGIWYLPVIRQNEKMRQQLLVLEEKNKNEERRVKQLKAAIEAMRDPRTIERLAREKLNFARPGETVIRFDAPATNSAPAATPR